MRRFVLLAAVVALAAGCGCPPAARAFNPAQSASSTNATTPGVDLAHAISQITGVAISPLLGVSSVGAWKYFHAQTPQQRARLPWFAQPWFWIPAFVLVAACFLKDTVGITAPRLLKKPLDVADALEHKVSGLIATGAFVPLIIMVLPDSEPEAALHGSTGLLAIIDFSWLGNGLLVPVAMFAFFIVFLASNALNVLLLLSPFGVIDAALKGFRLLVLLSVTATAFLNPWLGAAWALAVIVVAYFIAGWSFRLSHLGIVFLWDFLTLRRSRFIPDNAANKMFLARKINKVPARSYGKLLCERKGSLIFRYHPWLVLPVRTLMLPEGRYAVGKALFYSQIMRLEGDKLSMAMLLPPRYRGHEDQLAAVCGITEVQDVGLRAAFRWLKEVLGFRARPKAISG